MTDNEIAAGQPTRTEIDEVKRKLLAEFNDFFDTCGPLQTMAGPAMKIELLPNAKAFTVHRARPIPFVHRDAAKKALDKMVADGVITPVTVPTAWAH